MGSINLALLQANMKKNHGLSYHWLLDLFACLNKVCYKTLEKKPTDRAKEKEESGERVSPRTRREKTLEVIQHTYGSSDNNGSSVDDDDNLVRLVAASSVSVDLHSTNTSVSFE